MYACVCVYIYLMVFCNVRVWASVDPQRQSRATMRTVRKWHIDLLIDSFNKYYWPGTLVTGQALF